MLGIPNLPCPNLVLAYNGTPSSIALKIRAVEQDERLFTAVEWLDSEHIQLQDRDSQFWQLDINTGEIVQ